MPRSLGALVEACAPGSFPEVTADAFAHHKRYPNRHRLPRGAFTDDTSMALCLAHSVVVKKALDPVHVMECFRKWWKEGFMSSVRGRCVDIGNNTRAQLTRRGWRTKPLLDVITLKVGKGSNGGIMRLSPVAVGLRALLPHDAVLQACEDSSRVTHSTMACVEAARFLGALLLAAVEGEGKDALLAPGRFAGLFKACAPVDDGMRGIVDATYRTLSPPDIRAGAGVVDCLQAALWGFATTDSFVGGALATINLGNDADTVGAVYGQIAGAFYGAGAVPEAWLEHGSMSKVCKLADKLAALGGSVGDSVGGGAGAAPEDMEENKKEEERVEEEEDAFEDVGDGVSVPSPPTSDAPHRHVFISASKLVHEFGAIPEDVLEGSLLFFGSERAWMFPENEADRARSRRQPTDYLGMPASFVAFVARKEARGEVFWLKPAKSFAKASRWLQGLGYAGLKLSTAWWREGFDPKAAQYCKRTGAIVSNFKLGDHGYAETMELVAQSDTRLTPVLYPRRELKLV